MLKVSLSGSIDKPVYRKQLFFVRRLDSLIPEQISLKDILPDHHEHEVYRYVRFQQKTNLCQHRLSAQIGVRVPFMSPKEILERRG